MYFRWTLFNGITLFVFAATLLVAAMRFRARLDSNWFLVYYAIIAGFWRGFPGSLGDYWAVGGIAAGLLLRFEFLGGIFVDAVRVAELVFFGYVLWRCLALLLMWPW